MLELWMITLNQWEEDFELQIIACKLVHKKVINKF